jgi:asparagine synthase (glutamine-hydrolysing)
MSPQYGRWNLDGRTVPQTYFENADAFLRPFGPDGVGEYAGFGCGIIHRAFHVTREAHVEVQPYATDSGTLVMWDGRLDNAGDLVRDLQDRVSPDSADVAIVATAYERWGRDCLAKLIGDWALSVWEPKSHSLTLARDFVGTQPLYYQVDSSTVTWCSFMDPLLRLGGDLSLSEEYIAAWFSHFPAAHLTPYLEIRSVPPACCVLFVDGKDLVQRYWTFDRTKSIRYKNDSQYEDHFRQVLTESVRRRLRSRNPVLAELSGGMDSSSIVCIADRILSAGNAETPQLDTISYYDDSEPDWDERPYFSVVERRRGRSGCHINVSRETALLPEFSQECFASTPATINHIPEITKQFTDCLTAQENRVVLSGTGGDEALGGLPAPLPELADLLVTLRFRNFLQQSAAWALALRKPIFSLIRQTGTALLPVGDLGLEEHRSPPAWIETAFVKRNRNALTGYYRNFRINGHLPSFQSNLDALQALRRQLSSVVPSSPPFEKRYPYLDRDLWSFVCAIPREQVLRPQQRRSLMRRALAGIVPAEIINRRRKAFIIRGPMIAIAAKWPSLTELTRNMVSASLGIVNPKVFLQALDEARRGQQVSIVAIFRTLAIESWLRHIMNRTQPRSLSLANKGGPVHVSHLHQNPAPEAPSCSND